jgi:putative serine protease PepD
LALDPNGDPQDAPRHTRRGPLFRTAAIALASAALGGGIVAVADRGGRDGAPAATAAAPAAASPGVPAAQTTGAMSLREIYAERSPGVVEVRASGDSASGDGPGGLPDGQRSAAQGSGVVIDGEGRILTNAHVIDGQDSVTVAFADGSTARARVLGKDDSTDLALLDVDLPASALHPVPLGSSAALKVGDWVLAIGAPFGYDLSASVGIVSGLDRQIQSPNGFTISGAVQTDAAINHGSSGGALLDDRGRLIGITAQIADSGVDGNVGVGFAIPIDTATRVVDQLEKGGKVTHAWLGISGADAAELAAQTGNGPDRGAVVTGIVSGGPAAKAGLKAGSSGGAGGLTCVGGDVITAVDGRPVNDMGDLQQAVSAAAPGTTLTLTVTGADDRSRQVKVTLAAQPTSAPEPQTGC